MTEPMKTVENPRLELAIADAMRENIESTRIMDHVEPLKKVVEAYAAQQVAAERERIKNIYVDGLPTGKCTAWDFVQYSKRFIELIDSL